ncbi:MAG: YceI family protein [Gemmatimonadota bacterium]|nr:YceI family protein [Gemmatimonadota bacterium]
MRALVWLMAALAPLAGTGATNPVPPDEGEPRVYRLDRAHSDVAFRARYLKLIDVEGRFREWDAAIVGAADPADGAIAIVLRTASLDTGNERRDEHLKSPDFFDVERYPTIVFTSGEVVASGEGFAARGTLRMHGTSREIEVPFEPAYAPTTDAKGNDRAGFVGQVVVDRKAFGIVGGSRFNRAFDPRVSVIDDEVRIVFGVHVMVPPIGSPQVDSLVRTVEAEGVGSAVASWHARFPAGEGEEVERQRLRMARVHNAAGYRLLEAGRAEEGVELLRLAVLGAPESARAMSGLAEGYARAGMLDRARDAVGQALERDPHETRALALRAWLANRP